MKKRIIAILFATVMSFSLMACGGESESADSTSAGSTQSATTNDTAAQGTDEIAQQKQWLEDNIIAIVTAEDTYNEAIKGISEDPQGTHDTLAALSVQTTAIVNSLNEAAYYQENAELAQYIMDAGADMNNAILAVVSYLETGDESYIDTAEECMNNYAEESDAALTLLGV